MVQNGAKYNRSLKRWELPTGSKPTARMGVQGGEGEDSIPPLGQKKAALLKEEQRKAKLQEPKGDILELTDYGRKGANAYLVPVTVENGQVVRGSFESGKSSDYARAGAGKANNVSIDLSNKKDGWYEYQEGAYGSNRVYRGYIKVEGGRITDQIERDRTTGGGATQAFLKKVAPVSAMPELSGSPKQQSWAESIREKAVRSGKISAERAATQTDSRWWIDNRTKF